MNNKQLFKLLKARHFFPTYAPGIVQFYHKLNEWDGRKIVEFTEDDKKQIKQGVKKMINDLKQYK
jgi:hypothetical protein